MEIWIFGSKFIVLVSSFVMVGFCFWTKESVKDAVLN